uniref:Uncharacterized protein n=1 Tax=Rhizophora mucronata TaxID=61149 RepID=A0A2P2LMF6_RHIMU
MGDCKKHGMESPNRTCHCRTVPSFQWVSAFVHVCPSNPQSLMPLSCIYFSPNKILKFIIVSLSPF